MFNYCYAKKFQNFWSEVKRKGPFRFMLTREYSGPPLEVIYFDQSDWHGLPKLCHSILTNQFITLLLFSKFHLSSALGKE